MKEVAILFSSRNNSDSVSFIFKYFNILCPRLRQPPGKKYLLELFSGNFLKLIKLFQVLISCADLKGIKPFFSLEKGWRKLF
ncbi:MAG: hypothetical protein XD41_1375 [Desulfonauticus sp. 38_4375]|nr:MAG: hypothetical protein XD41_1375 [Desulfonauticus sp. 38_4375]